VLANESGIAAAAVAGLLAGAMRVPYEEAIREFKGDLTLVALSLVFVLLAASQHAAELWSLGWRGVALVTTLMVVVRPLAVGLATLNSGLGWRERAFVAWLGPRGIVAASLATLMGLELEAWKIQSSGDLAPLTFLTVLLTVLIEGGLAGRVARWLGVLPKQVLVVGGADMAVQLACKWAEDGEAVTMVATSPADLTSARAAGLLATLAGAMDAGALERAGLAWTHTVVAAMPGDEANLAVCELVRARLPDARLVAHVNDADRLAAFRDLGVEPLWGLRAPAESHH
jgi:hypothetical protein